MGHTSQSLNIPQQLPAIVIFLKPGHLNGFELTLGGGFGIVAEPGELNNTFVEIGEAQFEGIGLRKGFAEGESDVFGVIPSESRHVIIGYHVGGGMW